MSFERSTSVSLVDGRYEGDVVPGWDVVGNANGGYLLTIAARSMAGAAGRPHPVSITAHFLAPGRPGRVVFEPEVIKSGRTFTTVRGHLRSEDRIALTTLGTFSDLEKLEGPGLIDATPPDLPPPDRCIRVGHSPGAPFPPPMMDKIDLRLHPDDAPMGHAGNATPEFRGWLRPLVDDPLDVFFLMLAVDCFPPTIFKTGLPAAWTPTVELTAHIRGIPEPGWLRCRFSTRFITGGMLEEDGEVWDETGRLVAQSRQLALIPRG
jgi:acyl-coenzyme A thioesterase PaaI-like protein